MKVYLNMERQPEVCFKCGTSINTLKVSEASKQACYMANKGYSENFSIGFISMSLGVNTKDVRKEYDRLQWR